MSRSERGSVVWKLITLLCFAALCGLIYLIRHPLLRMAGGYWVVEDRLGRADAMIVLSDDNFYADRASRAAELYRQGAAPVVVASGRRLRPYTGIAELMQHDLVERGVPENAILRVPHLADDTREEAEVLRPVVDAHRWRSVVVVTSNSHTRRARYIFARVLPASVKVSVASARDYDYDPQHWWESRRGQKRFFHEAVGMIVAWWELRGTSKEALKPQSVVQSSGSEPQDMVSQGRKRPTFATTFSALQPLSPVISSRP
jgi:uncharacterized SAM-binding protein YcdF (DUF218 family)